MLASVGAHDPKRAVLVRADFDPHGYAYSFAYQGHDYVGEPQHAHEIVERNGSKVLRGSADFSALELFGEDAFSGRYFGFGVGTGAFVADEKAATVESPRAYVLHFDIGFEGATGTFLDFMVTANFQTYDGEKNVEVIELTADRPSYDLNAGGMQSFVVQLKNIERGNLDDLNAVLAAGELSNIDVSFLADGEKFGFDTDNAILIDNVVLVGPVQ